MDLLTADWPSTPSGALGESCRGAQRGALIPAPAGVSNVTEQRATLGLRVCTRPGCSRAFEPRGSGGRPQEFCTAVCRRRFNDEARRQARARLKKRATRARPARAWAWGTDAATGRRVVLVIHLPLAMAPPSSRPFPPHVLHRLVAPDRVQVIAGGVLSTQVVVVAH